MLFTSPLIRIDHIIQVSERITIANTEKLNRDGSVVWIRSLASYNYWKAYELAFARGDSVDRTALIALVNNASLLIALAVVYNAFYVRLKSGRLSLQNLISGLLLGVIAMAVMLNSWTLQPGVVFDTRTVVLGLTGLYFGAIPSLIAVAMTSILRFSMGGDGVYMGIATIISSTGIGLLWRYRRRRVLHDLSLGELYVFGLVVHLAMLACSVLLPSDSIGAFFSFTALPVMIIYPVASMLAGWAMSSQEARRKAEETAKELAATREELGLIFDAAPVAIISLDLDFKVTEWNMAAEKIFGWARSEVIGKPLPFVPASERESHRNLTLAALSGESLRGQMLARVRRDGTEVKVRLHNAPIVNGEGKVEGVLGILEDVTEQYRAEAALKESETRFRELYMNMTSGVAIYEIDKENEVPIFSDMNPAGCGITGVNVESIKGRDVKEVFPGVVEMGLYDKIIEVWKTGKPQHHPAKLYRDNELVFWAENYVYRHGSDEIVAVFDDITQKRRTLEELERRVTERTEELEAANRELEAFAYSVSHDLRAPLRAIKSFTQIISDRYSQSLPDDAKRFFGFILKAGDDMSQLIQGLLDYSRLGRTALNMERVSLAETVDETLEVMAMKIKGENAVVRVGKPLPEVIADRSLLNRILINLLDNAIIYHKPYQAPEINISAEQESGDVILSITDNGMGIDQKFRDRVFEIFQRLHSSEEISGTGLGLALVKKCVELIGGEITLESEPGKGSTFSVKLRGGGDVRSSNTNG